MSIALAILLDEHLQCDGCKEWKLSGFVDDDGWCDECEDKYLAYLAGTGPHPVGGGTGSLPHSFCCP